MITQTHTFAPDAPHQHHRTRYNREERRTQTYCCNYWWNGDTCLYGNHVLTAVAKTDQPVNETRVR